MDDEEEAYLRLPYKFREYQPLNSKDFEVECEARDTKLRWELMERAPPEEDAERQEEEQDRLEDKKAGEVFDKEGNTLQMSKLKVTALSKCPRLYPPRAAMNAEEVRIQGQRLEVMRQCGALIRDAEGGQT